MNATSAEFSSKQDCFVSTYARAQKAARESAKRGIKAVVQPYWQSYSMPPLMYIPDETRQRGYRIERS